MMMDMTMDGFSVTKKPGRVLVTGAGGFIGGHLVGELRRSGLEVRAVDRKPLADWYQIFDDNDNRQADLSHADSCKAAVTGIDTVFNLAADMGGMGFIETHKADCMLSVLINTNMLVAARDAGVSRFFFSSSACVYAADKQTTADVTALREEDAYPAMPEDGYGWEKLFSERMCRHFSEDFGMITRVARYHNVYGPYGTFEGGREKAPAALCRKAIAAIDSGNKELNVWGDGTQTRSFMFIEDCVLGIDKIVHCDELIATAINLGSSELISINDLADKVEKIAGVKFKRKYDLNAPRGVAGRNSDNTFIQKVLSWEPSTPFDKGLAVTYEWIKEQYLKRKGGQRVVE